MALRERNYCRRCEEQNAVFTCRSGGMFKMECDSCRKNEAASRKEIALNLLKDKSIEDRLSRIEEWIYDYKPEYVSPPRF